MKLTTLHASGTSTAYLKGQSTSFVVVALDIALESTLIRAILIDEAFECLFSLKQHARSVTKIKALLASSHSSNFRYASFQWFSGEGSKYSVARKMFEQYNKL